MDSMDSMPLQRRGMGVRRAFGCGGVLLVLLLILIVARPLARFVSAHGDGQRQTRLANLVDEIAGGGSIEQLPIHEAEFVERIWQTPGCAAKVKSIVVWAGDLADPRWAHLAQFPNLTEIVIYSCPDVDSLLGQLQGGLAGLQRLDFVTSQVSPTGMRLIRGFPSLRKVAFCPAFRAVDPSPLKGHAAIEAVRLDGVPVTDEWVNVLRSLPRLRNLDLWGEVTKGISVQDLKTALPNCTIQVSQR
mgnify:CR=1 FL=1